MSSRTLQRVINAMPASDGAGVRISRIAGFSAPDLEPFLMLDEIRSEDRSDFVAGFPDHPHRGIETLTYMRNGGFEHRDHLGHVGAIRGGGAQWMSAGKGIIHSETPLPEAESMHGFQIWINLPASRKLKPAEWQDAQPETLPLHSAEGISAKAVAGRWELAGTSLVSPLDALSQQASVLDVELKPGASLVIETDSDLQVAVFVYQGRLVSTQSLQRHQLGLYSAGERLTLEAGEQGLGALVLRGEPLGEPVAHYGPFVMNTTDELHQAVADYQNGTLTN